MPTIERIDTVEQLRRLAREARRDHVMISAYEAMLLDEAAQEITQLKDTVRRLRETRTGDDGLAGD